jgi:hypothetical protein
MGVVGCAVLVDIDPSAMSDCHRAIPISVGSRVEICYRGLPRGIGMTHKGRALIPTRVFA